MSLFTCDPDLGADATDLFNYLTGYSQKSDFRKLLVAPVTLRKRMADLIRREIALRTTGPADLQNERAGRQSHDPAALRSFARGRAHRSDRSRVMLSAAGHSGSEREHCGTKYRGPVSGAQPAYYFENGGNEEMYAGSADLMPRNLDRRVEILFPVLDDRLVRTLRDALLETCLADNRKSRIVKPDGGSEFSPVLGADSRDSQAWFVAHRGRT